MNSEEFFTALLELRGIDPGDGCKDCGASGTKTYGDTSTWRGGVGGQMMTSSVCNKCWGSGSKSRPWRSWRQIESLLRNEERRRIEEPALAGDEATAEQQIASLTQKIVSLQSTIDVRDATILSLEADREFMVQELGWLLEKLGKKDLAG